MAQSSDAGERIIEAAMQGGRVIAYQTGVLYPKFTDVDREELALLFEKHGFAKAAKRLRDIDAHRALASVVGRIGSHRRDGLRTTPLTHTEGDHVLAYQVEQLVQHGKERAGSVAGARVFSAPAGLFAAPPVAAAEIPACRMLAEELRVRADRLVTHADTGAVSRAITGMIEEARAFRFIAKGSYVLRAGDPTADRVVACVRDIRARFYDAPARSGIRASAVEIAEHGDNRDAVSDAVIDDAERQAAALVAQLRSEAGSATTRLSTLAKRREEAARLLASIAPVRDMLGGFAERIESIARAVADSYNAATTAETLSCPAWLTEATAGMGAADADPDSSPQAAPAPAAAPAATRTPVPAPVDDAFAL